VIQPVNTSPPVMFRMEYVTVKSNSVVSAFIPEFSSQILILVVTGIEQELRMTALLPNISNMLWNSYGKIKPD